MRNICLWFCFLAPSVAANCSNNLTHGYRLDSFTTEILSNIGVHACINECLLRKPHCQSINYNTQHFQCGINSREADDIEFEGVPDSNSIFANILNSSRVFISTLRCIQFVNMHLIFCIFNSEKCFPPENFRNMWRCVLSSSSQMRACKKHPFLYFNRYVQFLLLLKLSFRCRILIYLFFKLQIVITYFENDVDLK